MDETMNSLDKTKRHSRTCEEPIDLRDLFPSQCHPYRQDGITHFLDDKAEQYYLQQLQQYNGYYTQSVYENVLKHSAARSASDKHSVDDSQLATNTFNPPAVIPVGYSQHRNEQRLNFGTDIEIELPSGNIIKGRSVDISPSGLQIKLQYILDVINGMEMDISFPNLETKYEQHFGFVPYQLMKSDIGSMYMTLKLVRINPGEHPFDLFLQDFIDKKKHRYGIDAEDSKLALTAKVWEYLYTKSLPYLACFISTNGERLQIQEIAISEHNKHQIAGLGNSMLSMLEQQMSAFRLNGISRKNDAPPEIYAFRYQGSGLRRRICTFSWKFTDKKTRATFLKAGIREDTFVAWRINVIKLKEISYQRSNELLDRLTKEKPEQAESLMNQLNQYEYLIYLVDITKMLQHDPLLQHDKNIDPPDDNFFDPYEVQLGRSADFTRLRLGISKQRNEERYIYQSPILLKYYGQKVKGHTLDLSVNGLKIALDTKTSFQIRDTVSIDFVGFNKKFRSSKLKGQSYRIAAITPDGSLCLTRDYRIPSHEAAIFIGKLLNQNKTSLPSCTGELWMSTKSRLMESWLNLSLPTQSLLLTRNKTKYDIPYLLSGNYTEQLLAPFQIGESLYNFEKLLTIPQLKEKIRFLKVEQMHSLSLEVYISQYEDKNNNLITELKTWSDFSNDIERVEYLKKCYQYPVSRFYNLALARVPRLEKEELLDDMHIVRRNARHRLTEFEAELSSLIAIIELSDCTDIIVQRYNLKNGSLKRTVRKSSYK